jgi:hypothetical protein
MLQVWDQLGNGSLSDWEALIDPLLSSSAPSSCAVTRRAVARAGRLAAATRSQC